MAEYWTENRIGNIVDIVIHSQTTPRDTTAARRQKRQHTTLAQQARNNKNSAAYMALVAMGNFAANDLYVTLTYDDLHLPPNNKAVKADGERICRRLRSLWADIGVPLRYMRVIEGLESGKRYHHHMMINNPETGDIAALRDVLESMWGAGTVHIERINGGCGRSAHDLALYFYKEIQVFGRPAGTKAFSCSRNLDRGEPQTKVVPDGTPATIPAGIPQENILISDQRELLYSRYAHIRYIVPAPSGRKRHISPVRRRTGMGLGQTITYRHRAQKTPETRSKRDTQRV